jgi:hypothetical protein
MGGAVFCTAAHFPIFPGRGDFVTMKRRMPLHRHQNRFFHHSSGNGKKLN